MKAVPITSIVGAAMAFLAAVVLVPDHPSTLIVAATALAAAIIAFLTRTRNGIIAGAALVALFLLDAWASTGGISGEQGEILPRIAAPMQSAIHVLTGAAVAGLVLAVRWEGLDPPWLAPATAGALALAVLLGFILRDGLVSGTDVRGYLVGLLALAGLAPAIVALRNP